MLFVLDRIETEVKLSEQGKLLYELEFADFDDVIQWKV